MVTANEIKKRRPKDRRNQILNIAAELIAERGFAAVSVQDIGERTGITGGAIYRHFPSKQALLEVLLVANITMFLDQAVATSAEAKATQQPMLRPMITGALEIVEKHRGSVTTYVREFRRAEPQTRKELQRIQAQVTRCWRAAILEAQPDLSRADTDARLQITLGALDSVSRRTAVLGNPRIPPLLTDALEATLSSPPLPSHHAPEPANTWVGPIIRRQQIVSTATRLFSRSGFHGIGFNEVGEAVGIAGPSIYEHFDSKMDILLEIFEQANALVTAGMLQAVRRATSAQNALDLLIRSYVDVCTEFTDLIIVAGGEGGSLPQEVRPRLAARRRDIHETWIQMLRELRPNLSLVEARTLVRTSFAIILQLCRLPVENGLPPEGYVSLVRTFLTAGASSGDD